MSIYTTRKASITDGFIDRKIKNFVGINITDGFADGNNPSVNDASVIKNINITDGFSIPLIIFLILPTKNIRRYYFKNVGNNKVRNHH